MAPRSLTIPTTALILIMTSTLKPSLNHYNITLQQSKVIKNYKFKTIKTMKPTVDVSF